MSGNLCRCGAYDHYLKGVMRAAGRLDMAYKLIGKNFTPHDVVAKVTGKAKYAEDFRAEGMVFCKLLRARCRTPGSGHRRLRGPEDAGGVGNSDSGRRAAIPAAADPDPREGRGIYVGEPILALAAEDETIAADALEKIKVDLEQLPHVLDPLDSLYPGGPNARSNGNVAAAQINLQTVKWEASDFADDKALPKGKPAEQWSYGDLEAGFKAAKLIIEESFVTAGFSHHSMEPRSAMAYWQGGKCFLYGSNQSHTARCRISPVISASNPRISSLSPSSAAAALAARSQAIRSWRSPR